MATSNGPVAKLEQKRKQRVLEDVFGTNKRRSLAEDNGRTFKYDCRGEVSKAEIEAFTHRRKLDAKRAEKGKPPVQTRKDYMLEARASECRVTGPARVAGVRAIPFTPKVKR